MARLKAFTLLEITVALLLTGILVTMAYGMLGSFQVLADRSVRSGDDLQRFRELQLVLATDADRSSSLHMTEKGFAFATGTVDHINYERIADGLVRRTVQNVDSFQLPLVLMNGTWESSTPLGVQRAIDRLDLQVLVAGDTLRSICEQPYDAVTRRELR
jgi:prepilin-type N-terminal cleavage/methylation domain-containing protein